VPCSVDVAEFFFSEEGSQRDVERLSDQPRVGMGPNCRNKNGGRHLGHPQVLERMAERERSHGDTGIVPVALARETEGRRTKKVALVREGFIILAGVVSRKRSKLAKQSDAGDQRPILCGGCKCRRKLRPLRLEKRPRARRFDRRERMTDIAISKVK
jgi:hypothetical protein